MTMIDLEMARCADSPLLMLLTIFSFFTCYNALTNFYIFIYIGVLG
jgi:hypothetical protein